MSSNETNEKQRTAVMAYPSRELATPVREKNESPKSIRVGRAADRVAPATAAPEVSVVDKPAATAVVATGPAVPVPAAPRSQWQDLKEQAILAFESGLLPRSIDTRQKAVTIALMGHEFDLTPMQALCGIYVVNGMVALRGSLMLRLIYERVPGARISVLTPPEQADKECSVEMQRPGNKPMIFRFTMDDAQRAGFGNKPIWHQHPATMLRWAAIRTGARVVFADAIAGCYMEDELPTEAGAASNAPTETAEDKKEEVVAVKETPVVGELRMDSIEDPQPASEPMAARFTPGASAGFSRPLTDKQINRLFAIAHSKNWSRHDVTQWMQRQVQKRDPKQLTRAEYETVCNHLLTGPAKMATAEARN